MTITKEREKSAYSIQRENFAVLTRLTIEQKSELGSDGSVHVAVSWALMR